MACHGAGIAGAPKFGDKAAWAERVAQGADTLHKHALGGYQGKAGFMPPKGGRTDLTDQSVINAVDYMVGGGEVSGASPTGGTLYAALDVQDSDRR